jgi:stage V sporulation protein R
MATDNKTSREMAELMIYDKRMHRAGDRLGLKPYPVDYWYMHDSQITQILPHVGVPGDYHYWNKGKEAEKNRQNGYGGHIYEMVLNTNPSICYLSTTNTIPMQLHVMAHAVWGHVDFFANNLLFGETQPTTVLSRFKMGRNKLKALVDNPEWGWENLEYYMDAIHALENYVGWLPTIEGKLTDKELRDELKAEVIHLRRRMQTEGEVSVSVKRQLELQVALIEAQLKRYPIQPTNDLLGFLVDPENTPNLPEEVRVMLSIVRDRSRYFQPQARTKFMNEGWASYWQRELLLQPEIDLPMEYRFDLAQSWTMHDQQASAWYLDPYALGQNVWRYIDRKYGFDEGTTKIKVPLLKRDAEGVLYESKSTKMVEVTVRNRDKMMEVRRHYDDSRFLDEFVNEELFEYINTQALDWLVRAIRLINSTLIKTGWGKHVVDPIPPSIEELMGVVQNWMQIQETASFYNEQMGSPLFPVAEQTLQQMGMVLQIVAGFDADKHKARRQLVLRTGYHWVPNIQLMDTGKFGDNSWTLKHEWDENFGPLLQSECRDTLKYFWRIRGSASPVRLLTMEPKTNARGQAVGDPKPYEYYTEDGENVKERWL